MTARNAAFFVLTLVTLTFAVAQQTEDGSITGKLTTAKSTPRLVTPDLSTYDQSTPDLPPSGLFAPGQLLSGKHNVTSADPELEVFRAACEVRSGYSRAGGYCI